MIRDAGIALLLRLVGTALWLGYTIVLARLLSPEDFGLVLYALNALLIATPLASLGFEMAVMRFGAHYWQMGDRHAFGSLLREGRIMASMGGVLCLLSLLLATALRLETPITADWALAAIIGLCIPLSAIMTIHRDALHAAGRLAAALMGFTVTRAILPLIGSVLLGALGLLTPVSALALYAGSLGLSLIVESVHLSRLRGNGNASDGPHDTQARRRHLAVALGAWPGEIAWVSIVRATGLVVGLALSLETAALFLLAQRVAALSQYLAEAVRTAAAPQIARTASDPTALQNSVSKASALTFAVDGAAKLGLIAVGWAILLLFGEIYLPAYPVLVVLILGEINRAFLGSPALVMSMAGLQKERSVATIAAAIVMVGASWLGAAWFGPIGAATAYALTVWALNGWLAWRAYKRLDVRCGLFGVTGKDFADIFSALEARRLGIGSPR